MHRIPVLVAGTAILLARAHMVNALPDARGASRQSSGAAAAQASITSGDFEVATIKPSEQGASGRGFGMHGAHFFTLHTSVIDMVSWAWDLQRKQIAGAPAWAESEKFDIAALPEVSGSHSMAELRAMLQKLLIDRFALTFHPESREMPAFVLTVAKEGPRLTRSQGDPRTIPQQDCNCSSGFLKDRNASMDDFAQLLQMSLLDRPVVNQTGLQGRWDFDLRWSPDDTQPSGAQRVAARDDTASLPSLPTALQEQIGLKIEATKANVEILVIDHVDEPSPN
jgi:uncharacterized protein (TIGR03435 family)